VSDLAAVYDPDHLDSYDYLFMVGLGMYARAVDPANELGTTAGFPRRLSAFGVWLETNHPSIGAVDGAEIVLWVNDVIADYRLSLAQKPFSERN
jgi:hypothetical protein